MLDIKRMRMASNLLAAPGSEVVGQCLDEVETLRVELAALKAAARPFLDGVRLTRMREFIRNGVEMGYIVVPDKGDPARDIIDKICGGEE